MAVLPQHLPLQPGNWNPLNDFLSVGHNADGSLKNAPSVYNVKDEQYGAKGDGATDDTTTIQAAINACITAGGGIVLFPAGTYNITAPLTTSINPGWRLVGSGMAATTIRQVTDNTPILDIGTTAGSTAHSWEITDLAFNYTNQQASGNTSAICIRFSGAANYGRLANLRFLRGAYGIRVASGIVAPWGTRWDNLNFGGNITVGAIDMSIASSSGVPNNVYGRMSIDASNAIGPLFDLRDYNTTIDTIEVFSANQGPMLLQTEAGAELTIGAIKLENGTYSATKTLLTLLATSRIRIGHFYVDGASLTFTGAGVKITGASIGAGGGGGSLRIGDINLNVTSLAGGATCYAVQSSTASPIVIDAVRQLAGGWVLTDIGSTASADSLLVGQYMNGQLSANKGDADYTVALGDPNIITYETVLTAQRTVNLPATLGNQFNGLWYKVRSSGAVNAANTILVKCNTVTIGTIAVDKQILTFTGARRNGGSPQANWLVTGNETIP